MHRMRRGSLALLLTGAVVALGPAGQAAAETAPFPGIITVDPAQVGGTDDVITVTGPGTTGGFGCRNGIVDAVPAGEDTLVHAIPLGGGSFNDPGVGLTIKARDAPLQVGKFRIVILCSEGPFSITYTTDAFFTVVAGATTTTTSSTVASSTSSVADSSGTTVAGTQGSVEPSTATAGVTPLTIRGGGFKAAAELKITLNSTPVPLGTTTATANGAYAATLTLPATAPSGAHQLTVTGPGPDGVERSTTASLMVLAGSNTGSSGSAAAAGGSAGKAASATSALPKTGSDRASAEVMVGLTALTVGALLVGLSQPAVPARGHHRRRRRHGNHW